jgi:hypothetical protein
VIDESIEVLFEPGTTVVRGKVAIELLRRAREAGKLLFVRISTPLQRVASDQPVAAVHHQGRAADEAVLDQKQHRVGYLLGSADPPDRE